MLEWLNFPGVMERWFAQMREWREKNPLPDQPPRIYPDLAEIWQRQPIGYIGPPRHGLQIETIVFENGAAETRNAPPPWWRAT